MKNRLKSGFFGFIIGCILTFVMVIVPVSGGTNSYIDVVLNNINLMIDGDIVANKDINYTLSNGDQVPYSMVYKGTTYLPIRKIAEIINKEVGYIGETNTVVLGAMPQTQETGWYLQKSEVVRPDNWDNQDVHTFTSNMLASSDTSTTSITLKNYEVGRIRLNYKVSINSRLQSEDEANFYWTDLKPFYKVGEMISFDGSIQGTIGDVSDFILEADLDNSSWTRFNTTGAWNTWEAIREGEDATLMLPAPENTYNKKDMTFDVNIKANFGKGIIRYRYTYIWKEANQF